MAVYLFFILFFNNSTKMKRNDFAVKRGNTSVCRSLFLCVLCFWSSCNGQPSNKQPSTPNDSFFLRDLRRGSQNAVQDFLNYHTFLDTPINILRQFFGSQPPTNQNIPDFSDVVRRFILLSDKSRLERKNGVSGTNQQRASERKNKRTLSNSVRESSALRTGSKFTNLLKQTRHVIRQSIGPDPTIVNIGRANLDTRGIPNKISKSIARRGILITIDTPGINNTTGRLAIKDSVSSFNRGTASNDSLIQKVGRLSGLQTNAADLTIVQQKMQPMDQLRRPNVMLPDDDRVMQFIDNILARESTSGTTNDSRIAGSFRLDFPGADLGGRGGNKQTNGDSSSGITPVTSSRPSRVQKQSAPFQISAKDLHAEQHLVINTKGQNEMNNPSRSGTIFSEASDRLKANPDVMLQTLKPLQTLDKPTLPTHLADREMATPTPVRLKSTIFLHWPKIPEVKQRITTEQTVGFAKPINKHFIVTEIPPFKTTLVPKNIFKTTPKHWHMDIVRPIVRGLSLESSPGQNLAGKSNSGQKTFVDISNHKGGSVVTGRVMESRVIPDNTAQIISSISNTELFSENKHDGVKTARSLPIPENTAEMTLFDNMSKKRLITEIIPETVKTTRKEEIIPPDNILASLLPIDTLNSITSNANVPTTNIGGPSKIASEMKNVFDNGLTELGNRARNVEHSLNQAHFDVINRLLKRWHDNIANAQPVWNNISNSNMFSLITSPRASDTFMNHQANSVHHTNPELSRLVSLESAPLLRNVKQGFKISSPTFAHATSTNSIKATPDDALLNNFYEQHQSLPELKTLPDLPSLPTVGMDYTPHIYSKGKFNNAIHKAALLKVPAKDLGTSQFNQHMVMPFSLDGNKVHTWLKGVTQSSVSAAQLRADDC